nr:MULTISPECIES: hypothetical protein [Halorussus]
MDYLGHPYYVSGNAIYRALGRRVENETHRQLNASHGMFVPGEFGTFPEWHSQAGVRPYLGASLPPVETYDDLFLFRRPDHPWLLDSRPRDALNTHDIRVQSGMPALAHETIIGRPDDARDQQQTVRWYISAYLHAEKPDILPIAENQLDGLQFGGKRSYGYGTTRLKNTQIVDLAKLDYTELETSESFTLELLTPFVLWSEYPGTNDVNLPGWWQIDDEASIRHRVEKIVEGGNSYKLETVDHGTLIKYGGDRPVQTAINGIRRIGSHSKYGFGEFRMKSGHSTQDGVFGTEFPG